MKKNYNLGLMALVAMLPLTLLNSCKKNQAESTPIASSSKKSTNDLSILPVVTATQTNGDQSKLLELQPNISFTNSVTTLNASTITVDENSTFQTMDGFGFALTSGSATLLNGLGANQTSVLNELFGTGAGQIGISYLRISIGASDMSANDFTYDETPGDVNLNNFSIAPELVDLVPILKKILTINPNLKIMATPWTAPTWMKINIPVGNNNNGFSSGILNPQYYDVYAKYFVKYIQAMQAQGIRIDAVSPQNEPLNKDNEPSMVMTPVDQAAFINKLGPQLASAGLTTKIICYDHNVEEVAFPMAVLANPLSSQYVDGSAFHDYGPAQSLTVLSALHTSFPTKNIYFTEQFTGFGGSFSGDLGFHMTNLIIGGPNNWCKNVLEWALATDPMQGPHTPGGSPNTLGSITVNGTTITRNVGYYIVAHASKFVRPGAVRIASGMVSNLPNVAYKNADGSKVLIVYNSASSSQVFNVQWGGQSFNYTLPVSSVVTFKWSGTQTIVPIL